MSRKLWPPLIDGRWLDTHRLIPDAYATQDRPFLADLGTDNELDALAELTAATNARLLTQDGRSTVAIEPQELVFDLSHTQVINGAFTYPGLDGARFSDRTRGAWYAATDVTTSLAEVTFHKNLEWAEIDRWHERAVYVDYIADIAGPGFADLTGTEVRTRRCLQPGVATYVHGQQLARELLPRGASGVVYPSVRRPAGTCIACFRPALLTPVAQGASYVLTWSGAPQPTVTRE
ncbi:MAG: RES family NAD+ phosphorylase [Frankiaceae bacterium]|nr:RES family NAD+ phosphorylase [Frankiaceae bacterium]